MLFPLVIALAPAAVLPQEEGTVDPSAPEVPQEAPAEEPGPDVRVWSSGAIEAPTQPRFGSSSEVRQTSRFAPAAAPGPLTATRSPVGSLVAVRGMEDNHLMGFGLVDGLAGTGDSGAAAKIFLQNALLSQNQRRTLQELNSENIAIVRVEAELPAGLEPGRRIDVRVSSIGDASSLQGGNLLFTELTDVRGNRVYATASGPITVGGFTAEGESASATRNHVTVGTLPGGGKVETEVPTTIVSEFGYLYLDARSAHDNFGNIVNVAEAVNELYPNAAEATADGKSVRVKVPTDLPPSAHAAFAQSILRLEVLSQNTARVIINERSGVIVMGGDVRLQPGVINYGNLTVTVAETREISQPGPLSGGTTQSVDRTELGVDEENNALILAPGAATLQEVVDVLNVLGTTPRDMITILQAMSQSGTLLAEIRRM